MLNNKNIIAIVPARSGSKGILNKNMRTINGISLIGLAGECLNKLNWIDIRLLSTDSELYAEEGRMYNLDSPFLRTPEVSSDKASAVETIIFTLKNAEKYYKKIFDIVLIIEPTSPMRKSEDIENCVKLLINSDADSVVSVSKLNTKSHPKKILKVTKNNLLTFYEKNGNRITARQSLSELYWRNGVCYVLTRKCILEKNKIFTKKTLPYIIEREIVNIDEEIDFKWAEFLLANNS